MMNRQHGFTLLELVISLAVLVVLVGVSGFVMLRAQKTDESIRIEDTLTREGSEALERLIEDLRNSGTVEISGTSYPTTTDLPIGGPLEHRQIQLATPLDADNNGEPDITIASLDWDTNPVEYRVDTVDGRTRLLRRHGTREEVVLNRVERVFFDTAESSGWVVPIGAIRVELDLRVSTIGGTPRNQRFTTIVRMRNGAQG